MSAQDIFKDAEHRMQAAVDAMVHDFASYRTGRASPAVLDRVHVEYYGTETPISQLANISVPEPETSNYQVFAGYDEAKTKPPAPPKKRVVRRKAPVKAAQPPAAPPASKGSQTSISDIPR